MAVPPPTMDIPIDLLKLFHRSWEVAHTSARRLASAHLLAEHNGLMTRQNQ